MKSRDGAGLAAPQLGEPVGIFLIAPWVAEAERPDPLVFVNPEITWVSEEKVREKEGCLSFPDIWVFIERPARCRVQATNMEGAEFTVEAGGLFARALQHEFDHLNGTLMTDFFGKLKQDMIRKKLKKKRR
jgi:peptide deformylase